MTLRLTEQQFQQLQLPGIKTGRRKRLEYVPLEAESMSIWVDWCEAHHVPYVVSVADFYATPGLRDLQKRYGAAVEAARSGDSSGLRWLQGLCKAVEAAGYAQLTNLRKRGWRKGVLDACNPVLHRTGRWGGLWLEAKRLKNGQISDAQRVEAERLRSHGQRVEFPRGHEQMIACTADYMGIEP